MDDALRPWGWTVANAHPFFAPDLTCPPASVEFPAAWYEQAELERFRGDGRWTDALAFQRAVLEKLEGDTPVLGVVREGFPGWTKAIVTHPNVELITVTEDKRDALPALLLARLRAE